ncbi:Tryptophan-rich sensory protein [Abditibacterium utsteinense]|uniref:Tryptophan-rich sensory protein n=1 Tax=Abditibacterium utsteinense TaxID=1960156 RepID=A0A2S8SVT4_9BACT|nr:TspO/MBR family protein [Abditibacterium utsteinense]PQV64898.1 Tryptophan-rich sensory protein [Abditibacterium utsteinense]
MLFNRTVWPKIALGILICELAGVVSALFTFSGVRDWYPSLIKPPWTPPAEVFGPVWMLLYALMGAALGLVWAKSEGTPRKKRAMTWFWVQLSLNVAWSAAFFGGRSPGWAYAIILLLWLAIVATMWLFSKISSLSGLLLWPYLLWVTFGSALNFGILSLNIIKPTVQEMDKDPRNGPKDQKEPAATLR